MDDIKNESIVEYEKRIESEKKQPISDLLGNEYVKKFLSLLKENNVNTDDFMEITDYVKEMEKQLNNTVHELSGIRKELRQMNKGNNSIRHELREAERRIGAFKKQIDQIKQDIVAGCKKAITACKEKGVTVLYRASSFFHIKEKCQSIQKQLQSNIRSSDFAINRIEKISQKYHEMGRRVTNMGRALTDKEMLMEVKPSGKISNTIKIPFRSEKRCYEKALSGTKRMIHRLDELEISASKIAQGKSDKTSSVVEKIKDHKKTDGKEERTAPVMKKAKKTTPAL